MYLFSSTSFNIRPSIIHLLPQLTGLGAKLKTTEGEVEKWRLDLSKVLLEMQSKDSELQHCKKQFTQLQQVNGVDF